MQKFTECTMAVKHHLSQNCISVDHTKSVGGAIEGWNSHRLCKHIAHRKARARVCRCVLATGASIQMLLLWPTVRRDFHAICSQVANSASWPPAAAK